MRHAIGMDVGGTSVRVGLVREDGQVVAQSSQPTGIDTPRDEVLTRFADALAQVMRASGGVDVQGAGIGMPGLQDELGYVDAASNLPALNGFDLRGWVADETGLKTAMENDMNLVGLGEYQFGGHAVPGNLLVVAIGTGVGAALLQGGRLLRVARGCLGDPGHVLVEFGGRLCRCGAHGCLEAYASGWSMLERAEEQGLANGTDPLRPVDLFRMAGNGDERARTIVWRAADALAMGLASFCALYQPERIVLGGNVLLEGRDLLLDRALERFRAIVQPWLVDVPTPLSTIPQTAGVLGGAALVLFHGAETWALPRAGGKSEVRSQKSEV